MVGPDRVRRTIAGALASVVVVLAALAAPALGATSEPDLQPAVQIPFFGLSPEVRKAREDLDAATARALELEEEVSGLRAELEAIAERIAVTSDRMRTQRIVVARANQRLEEAQARYDERIVQVYKRGALDPMTILFSADTLSDLLTRAGVLSRLAEEDAQVVSDLKVAAADALYQQTVLEDLMAQDSALEREQKARLKALERALDEQEALVERLSEEARAALLEARRFDAETRQSWREASLPLGIQIPRAVATVEPYADRTYQVSAYMPRRYETTGVSWTAVASWYGPGFHGRGTASGQVFNAADFTCASRTLPFGTVLALTLGEKRVIVYVNDRGPYVEGRDLDLSAAAARALGFWGVTRLHAEIITPVMTEPVASAVDVSPSVVE